MYSQSSLPSQGPSSQQDSDDEEGGNEEEEDDVEDFDRRFPLSHEITLSHGSKPISALTLDPSGARVVTGGYDYNVRLWDFAGMDSTFKSFRTITPCQRCGQVGNSSVRVFWISVLIFVCTTLL